MEAPTEVGAQSPAPKDPKDDAKAHTPGHYKFYIELYGTTDNYNTENTERLHIDLTKEHIARRITRRSSFK